MLVEAGGVCHALRDVPDDVSARRGAGGDDDVVGSDGAHRREVRVDPSRTSTPSSRDHVVMVTPGDFLAPLMFAAILSCPPVRARRSISVTRALSGRGFRGLHAGRPGAQTTTRRRTSCAACRCRAQPRLRRPGCGRTTRRNPEQAVDAALVAADERRMSSRRPSRILFAVSGSAICWRVIATMSAWPRARTPRPRRLLDAPDGYDRDVHRGLHGSGQPLPDPLGVLHVRNVLVGFVVGRGLDADVVDLA